jgi:hypothetical protein
MKSYILYIACWVNDDTCDRILINKKFGGKNIQLLTYNVVIRKVALKEKDLNGYIINIYRKPQRLIN